MISKRKRQEKIYNILQKMLIIFLGILVLIPFYVGFIYSIKLKSETTLNRMAWPAHPTLSNYISVITENNKFLIGLKNSLLTTLPTVLLLLIVTSMAAWVLARNNTKLYRTLYTIFTIGILIPFQCIMLPLYKNMYTAGLSNSLFGFVIARAGIQIPISLLVVTSFVKTVPVELEEASFIDGGTRFQTFWRVVFPLMKPINATQAVLNALFVWNDYNVALVLLRDNEVQTLPLAQVMYFSEAGANLNMAFAFFIMTMLPILILYLSLQKYIVNGIMAGAVKG